MVKKMISLIGALGAVFGTAFAADIVVWPGESTMAPANWYDYTNGKGASISYSESDDIQKGDISVTAGSSESGAGFGFNWKDKEVATSLSGHKGVCLTYRATGPFRVDFKQSTISDYNYYGAELKASAVFKKQFLAFEDLKQGWKSTKTTAWNVASQTGMQFSYKNTHATKTQNTNTIEISSIILADECETHEPKLVAGLDEEYNLNEGDTLKLDLSQVFTDEDGDIESYEAKIVPDNIGDVDVADDLYVQNGMLNLVTGKNPKGNAAVTVTATDASGKKASYAFTVNTIDGENAPVAVNLSYTVKEDAVLKVTLSSSGIVEALGNMDYDGDKFKLGTVTQPEHGTLTVEDDGTFTYTPEADFFGKDEFTYTLVEDEKGYNTEKPEGYTALVSEAATVTITVENTPDPLVVAVVDSTISALKAEYKLFDTITVKEDFDIFEVDIPKANVLFSDPDVGTTSVELKAMTSGIVKAEYKETSNNHAIIVSPVADANGVAKVNLFAVDGKDTAGVWFYVKVEPQNDAPIAVDDKYNVYQDSLNKVAANKGVLANDKNPDGKTTFKAYLKTGATNGTVKMDSTGAFTYEAGSELGEDSFTYFIVNAEGDTSEVATVTLTVLYKNKAPQVVEGVADTVGNRLSKLTEDFTSRKTFARHEVFTWFKDDSTAAVAMTYTVRSDDSLLAPAFQSGGALIVDAVKNACGDAEIIVTATDGKKASTELKIPAHIACENDKPELLKKSDTVYVGTKPVWKDTFDLASLFKDVDGDTLKYEVTAEQKSDDYIKWTVKGSKLIVSSKDSASLAAGSIVFVNVKASDAETAISTKIAIYAAKAPTTGIAPVIAMPKATWQNAIRANRGAVALIDMQGRVMWKAKLPVSEADVRNAAAAVQGRKILRVNKQTWTIK